MRSSPVAYAGLALAASLLLSAPATAQEAQTRQGFFFSGGLGYGSMGLHCDRCDGLDREGGPSLYLAFGGALSPNFRLGVELNGWVKSDNGNVGTLSSALATAYAYPITTQGFFLKGGLGYSALIGDFDAIDQDLATQGGLGLLLGAGYDIPLGGNVALGPFVNYLHASLDEGVGANVLQAGLGITLP